MHAVLWYGSSVVAITYCTVCCVPWTHNYFRNTFRPWVLSQVQKGLPTVQRCQAYADPRLTYTFSTIAHTVSVPFYVSVLPSLLWLFGSCLCWRLAFLMTIVLYVGNSMKDLFCAPRPFSAAVQRSSSASSVASCSASELHGEQSCPKLLADDESEDFQVHAKEYGLPSSHTMNTLALNFYVIAMIVQWYQPSLSFTVLLYSLASLWLAVIAFSRMYLGFHTPVDIICGALLSSAFLVLFNGWADTLDQYLMSSRWSWLTVLGTQAVLLRLYPRPLQYTPSFEYTVSFMGAAFGLAAGMRRGSLLLPYLLERSSLWTVQGIYKAVRRMLTGIGVIVIMKEVCRASLLWLLPPIYHACPGGIRALWQPPLVSLCKCDSKCPHQKEVSLLPDDTYCTEVLGAEGKLGILTSFVQVPINAKGQPWDADVTARFFAYASIGWAVVDVAPRVFEALGW